MYKKSFGALLLVALFYGCGTAPPKQSTSPSVPTPEARQQQAVSASSNELRGNSLVDAQRLEQKGDYIEAAKLYGKLAKEEEKSKEKRASLWLRSALSLANAQLPTQANLILNDIDPEILDKELVLQYSFVRAKIALAERNVPDANEWLSKVKLPVNAPLSVHTEYLQALIRASELAGDVPTVVRYRMQYGGLLSDPDQQLANQSSILTLLSSLPTGRLDELFKAEKGVTTFRGWVSLALVTQQSNNVGRLGRLLGNWKSENPRHPALPTLLDAIAPRQTSESQPPNMSQVALLLPFEGPFAEPAEAVRDGVLAAYYAQEVTKGKPSIRVYNTGADPKQITTVYKKAVDEGATVVIGPITKEAVEALATSGDLPVPTLALNQVGDAGQYRDNLYQFSLAPEDEAEQVANKAWFDGHNRVAIFYPEGAWGERVKQAFTTRWEALGGSVAAAGAYSTKTSDYSKLLTSVLDIDDSNDRFQKIGKIVGVRMLHEPRRRQDIDFVFMIARPREGRLIPPQLEFHQAADLPIYTTSHSFSGQFEKGQDHDMAGVIIGDMPWTLQPPSFSPIKKAVDKTWPQKAQQQPRLYGLGVDAYNVLYYLNWLRTNQNARWVGVTGSLQMDVNNRLRRQLSWARFSANGPQILNTGPLVSGQ